MSLVRGVKTCQILYSSVSNPHDCSKGFTFYSLAELFNQTPYWLHWEASSHAAINTQCYLYTNIHHCLQLRIHSYSQVNWTNVELNNFPTQSIIWQHRIQTRVLLVESLIQWYLSYRDTCGVEQVSLHRRCPVIRGTRITDNVLEHIYNLYSHPPYQYSHHIYIHITEE